MKAQIRRRPLAVVLAGALVLRLLLAALPGFPSDVGYFRTWAEAIASHGPEDFYAPGQFHNYAPGYMWVLWLFGDLDEIFGFGRGQWDYLLKLPSIAADLGSAYVLYLLLGARQARTGIAAAGLYLVFPPTLLIGAIWGQVDSILAFFILLTVYFLVRDRPVAAAVAFTVAFLVKPQAIAALPFLVFWVVRDHRPALPRMIGASLGTSLVVAFPFFPSLLLWRPIVDVVDQLRSSASEFYPLNTFFAFNFWEVLFKISADCDVSVCRNDESGAVTYGHEFLGLTTRSWGLLLYAISVVLIVVALRKARGLGFLALGTSLCLLAFFVFMTRMHERYLFPVFLPLLVACVRLGSRSLWRAFGLLAAVHFLNLYYVYTNADGDLRLQFLYDWLRDTDLWGTGLATGQLLAGVVLGAFLGLVPTAYRLARAG